MRPEKSYYPAVRDYIARKFQCIGTGVNRGHLALGLADVIGAYDISSEHYSDVELIIVEIKTSADSFGKSVGQALGYSIFGERCYLAVTFCSNQTFTSEQVYIANHLGVGLIKIPIDAAGKPKTRGITTELSSKKHEPIPSHKHNMLFALGIMKCCICGIFAPIDNCHQIQNASVQPALFSKRNKKRFSYCQNCYEELMSQEKKEKRAKILNAGRKAITTKKRKAAGLKAAQTRRENARLKANENIG